MAGLTTSDGTPTGVLYGVLNFVRRELVMKNQLVFCWDSYSGWRRKVQPLYKSNRTATSDDGFRSQVQILQTTLSMLKIIQVTIQGYEADDIIGSLCVGLNQKVQVLSTDQDLIQLVSDKVTLLRPIKKKPVVVTAKSVKTELGIEPKQWPMMRALCGDKSDCLPGVEGIGPVKARRLLAAGVDPSQSEPSQAVKESFPHVAKVWKQVHANYQVSVLKSEQAPYVKDVLELLAKPRWRTNEARASAWRNFTKFCAEYELAFFLTNRSDFF